MTDERDRDDLPDNVIPLRTRAAESAQSRPYLEPPERYQNIAAVSKLVTNDGQPTGRVGLFFFIRGYPGLALTPTQARELGRLLQFAADDADPIPPKASS